jgi:hypothetical protein
MRLRLVVAVVGVFAEGLAGVALGVDELER